MDITQPEMQYRHIHIFGAAGSGTTTLAAHLTESLPHTHFDSDDFFWKTKYSEIRPRNIRLNLLRKAIEGCENWILSGAVIDWGNPLITMFDLVIFISVTNEIRLNRLRQREYEKFGNDILPNGNRHKEFVEFMEWAEKYETGGTDVRSRLQQETWLKDIPCAVLRINGDSPVSENCRLVLEKVRPDL